MVTEESKIPGLCDEAIAGWRKSMFIGGCGMLFCGGLFSEFVLYTWAQWPDKLNVFICIMHAFNFSLQSSVFFRARKRRHRWVRIKLDYHRFAAAPDWSLAKDCYLDQVLAGIAKL